MENQELNKILIEQLEIINSEYESLKQKIKELIHKKNIVYSKQYENDLAQYGLKVGDTVFIKESKKIGTILPYEFQNDVVIFTYEDTIGFDFFDVLVDDKKHSLYYDWFYKINI